MAQTLLDVTHAGQFPTQINSVQQRVNLNSMFTELYAGVKVAAPASAAATGVAGTWASDTGFIYICTATNTWKRVAIATW